MLRRSAVLLLLACAAALPAASSPGRADEITLAADEWCPYNCAPGSDRPGYMVEIARFAFERAGHTVRYVVLPWTRALEETRSGNIDGAIGASREEYPTAVFPKGQLGVNTTVLGLAPEKAAAFRYTGVEALAALRIGGVQNYSYDGGPIDQYLAGAGGKVELLSGTDAQVRNLRKLLSNRIDAVIENENVLRLTVAEMKPRPDIAIVPVGAPTEISIAFGERKPTAQRNAALIDAAMIELRRSGKLEAILARYGLGAPGS